MDRDTFIITVYCLVVEHYASIAAHFKLRRGGFQPTSSPRTRNVEVGTRNRLLGSTM